VSYDLSGVIAGSDIRPITRRLATGADPWDLCVLAAGTGPGCQLNAAARHRPTAPSPSHTNTRGHRAQLANQLEPPTCMDARDLG
jgi:hypothetical protein